MINTQKFNSIVEAAKAKTNDPKWLRAIERAAAGILSGEFIVTTLAHGALVTTANGAYAVGGACSCEAARNGHTQCKHRSAARLMDIYERETAPEAVALADDVALRQDIAASPRENLIIEIENIWNRVETTPLAVALMARFGVNQLQMLNDSLLRDIRLAIAM